MSEPLETIQSPDVLVEEPVQHLSPLLEAIKRPIPGENPCGGEVRYDDDFLKIKAEIDRIGTVSAKVDQAKAIADAQQLKSKTSRDLRELDKKRDKGDDIGASSIARDTGGVDYPLIIETATKILTEKSKDLQVASYLCFALSRAQRFEGLAEGLAAVSLLLQEFWEGLYPAKTRMAARKSAIDFLTQKLAESLEGAEVRAGDREPLENAKTALVNLEKALADKIPEDRPVLMGVTKAVNDCLLRVPKPISQPPAGAALPGKEGPTTAPMPVGGGSTTPLIELRSQQDAFDLIRKTAGFLRSLDRKSPLPYRLLRIMRWEVLAAEPPNENGKTKIPAIEAQRRNYFTGLHANGQWDKLIEEGEASFGQSPFHFWLDLQRLIASAMEALGDDFQNARSAVLQELAVLLKRVPKLPNLTFNDGTRFADPATQDWIEETVLPALGGGESAGTGIDSTADVGELALRFTEAKKILGKGDLAGAVAYLQDSTLKDNSRKARFLQRFYLAALCARGNQPKMALPLLEDLNAEIEKYALYEWEPSLTLEVWTSLYRCYEALAATSPAPGKPALQQSAEGIFEKICQLDMRHALAVTGAKPKTKRSAKLPEPQTSPPPQDGEDTRAAEGAAETEESLTTEEQPQTTG